MNEFKPGLEGIVAVETEIAEPDRDGGQLRYRGIDIEELVGHYPYERVWGLLVDNDLDSVMPAPEPDTFAVSPPLTYTVHAEVVMVTATCWNVCDRRSDVV